MSILMNKLLLTPIGDNMSFADELRSINQRVKVKEQRKATALSDKAKRQDARDKEWAKLAIETVKRKALKAAKQGEKAVSIKELDPYKIKFVDKESIAYKKNQDLTSLELLGRYKYLYMECVAIGLKPRVCWTHDGVGIRDWYEFIVTW